MSLSGSEATLKPGSTGSIGVIVAVGILSVLLWNMPGFGWLLYPFRLFVTFLHESSHGLAAILTGGRLAQFVVNPDTSGLAYTYGGFRPFISSAGYLGGSLWGGMLLLASRRRGWEKAVLLALAAFFCGFTLLFVRNFFGFFVGLGFAAAFGWMGWHGKNHYLSWLLTFLAVQNCFAALDDVRVLVFLANGPVATDAGNMSREMTLGLVPPIVFALGMAAAALVIFLFFLRLALMPDKRHARA